MGSLPAIIKGGISLLKRHPPCIITYPPTLAELMHQDVGADNGIIINDDFSSHFG